MKKVLIINNDDDFQLLVSNYLSRSGYYTETIKDEEGFMEKIESYQPDLIILDVEEVNDIAIFRTIKSKISDKKIPILALTGLAFKINHEEITADAYIDKPFNPKELVGKVESLVGRYL